jgi:hypothetical protein
MSSVIPSPRSVARRAGVCALAAFPLIYLPPDSDPLDVEAARLLQAEIARVSGHTPAISRAMSVPVSAPVISLMPDASVAGDEGYSLLVDPDGIRCAARTPRGRLWAVQTLRQLLRLHGDALPAQEISDAPAMRYRGVLLDVARRKVPTVETLCALVDTLSLFKLNMLQLQVEHTFTFRRHPRIGEGCGSLTCEDILALDAHCRARGVELVPMLQSFGHMRNILQFPEYRHLAENETHQWSLNPTDPATLQFLDELYDEYLPAHSSGLVNIGCDETVDLGRKGGKSNAAIAAKGQGRVYIEHILNIHRLLTEKYGKQVMLWGDIILHHPDLVPEMPKDLIVLNWGYEPLESFPQVDLFADSGLPQIVCPGTNSWNAIFPRLNAAWQNVGQFVRDGRRVGALGMLNTDWGDGGHYNLLGNSLYSYAHGAEESWAAAPMAREAFDTALGPVLYGAPGAEIVAALRRLGDAVDNPTVRFNNSSLTVQCLFSSPMEDKAWVEKWGNGHWQPLDAAIPEGMAAVAREVAATLKRVQIASLLPDAVADAIWACEAVDYAARKMAFFIRVMAGVTAESSEPLLHTGDALLREHEAVVAAFKARWRAGNRESEINVALGRFAYAETVLRSIVDWLHAHRASLAAGAAIPLPPVPVYQPPWVEDTWPLWVPDTQEEVVG